MTRLPPPPQPPAPTGSVYSERLRVPAAVAAGGIAAVGLDRVGLGGEPLGFLICMAIVGVAALLAFALVGGLRTPRRGTVLIAVAVLSAVAAAALVERAPPSVRALSAKLDGATPDGFVEVGERREGNPRCQPSCPAVVRRYRAAASAPHIASSRLVLKLYESGIIDRAGFPGEVTRPEFSTENPQYLVEVDAIAKDAAATGEPAVEVVVRLEGRRSL